MHCNELKKKNEPVNPHDGCDIVRRRFCNGKGSSQSAYCLLFKMLAMFIVVANGNLVTHNNFSFKNNDLSRDGKIPVNTQWNRRE